MGISQDKIQRELDRGFNIFCATCVHHHNFLDKDLEGCHESSIKACGGPFASKDFPEYLGVIPRDMFREICLICGSPGPSMAIYVNGKHTFSLCPNDEKAIEVLPSMNMTIRPIIAPIFRSSP